MNIQTAGEQKYYDFIEERDKSLRMGLIIWVSLLAVAFIASLSSIKVGILLGVVGGVLAVLNVKSQKALKDKLAGISDKADFFNQLIETDAEESKDYRLLITKDYVLKYKGDVYIYRLADMKKVEVGIEKSGAKHLFLTDKSGNRQELAECSKDDGEEFDRVYRILNERVAL